MKKLNRVFSLFLFVLMLTTLAFGEQPARVQASPERAPLMDNGQYNWTAYNDCVYDPRKAEAATNPNGQRVHYIGANVTTWGIGLGYPPTGPAVLDPENYATSGFLKDQSTGSGLPVKVTLTQFGGVHWEPDVNGTWFGGYDPQVGTDARNVFGGIADMTGTIYYATIDDGMGRPGWWVDLKVEGLNPDKQYEFVTSAVRANPNAYYANRNTIYAISGIDAAVNSSTEGTKFIDEYSVYFNTGNNRTTGYVARWTAIQPGSDGTFTVRAMPHPTMAVDNKAYAFDVFMIREADGAPLISNPGDQSDAEADTISLGFSAVDPEGTPLTYSAQNLPPGLSIDPATGQITGTLTYKAAGTYASRVIVTDSGDPAMSARANFTWTVANTNRPPVIQNPGSQENAEGEQVSVQVNASDPDEEMLTFTASGLPGGLVINPRTGLITGRLNLHIAGLFSVTVTAGDGFGQSSTTFSWRVLPNDPPTTLNLSGTTVYEKKPAGAVVGTLSASDPNPGDWQVYSFASGIGDSDNSAFYIEGNKLKTNMVFRYYGQRVFNVRIRVTDRGGLYLERTFRIRMVTSQRARPWPGVSVPRNVRPIR